MGYRDAQLMSSAPQSAYSTAQTLDRWHPYSGNPGLGWIPNDSESDAIYPGSVALDTDTYRATETAGGSIDHEVKAKGFGRFYKAALGAGVSTLVSGGIYQQNFTPSSNALFDALTLQLARPQLDGTTFDVDTFIGCVVKSLEFKMDNKGVLTMSVEWDAQTMSTIVAKGSPSITYPNRFTFAGFSMSTGTLTEPTTIVVGSAITPLDGIKSFSLKIENEIDAEDFRANGVGLKAQPTVSRQTITGSLEGDYIAQIAAFRTQWRANGSIPLVANFAAGTDLIQFVMPSCRISDPVVPNADGKQPNATISFEARKAATPAQALWITCRTADLTL